eukprot:CAMPEP_0174323238 /NCGR_PEP_ID=MMETSP0810-20121108/11649_1 /TAXON_ID=73025 ORGANISM="Eutreptiella gymnastica-like, Strain CCMP1594" /NCGR_SAMPLE_ID=MMETSP0810 /ASSEMBLY_ACC=CAM_ASM_000659 /LENGTH=86 /DNA_ID=CAMNT_0015435549 /DNA_START=312 /DNA_END=572 /DNA_ORIENTATION=-
MSTSSTICPVLKMHQGTGLTAPLLISAAPDHTGASQSELLPPQPPPLSTSLCLWAAGQWLAAKGISAALLGPRITAVEYRSTAVAT